MVKLDVSRLRFLDEEDFRVLTALEMAMRNHDVAPTALVERIAQLPHGGCRRRLQNLLKHKMIHHENTMYDGFAMKYGAYDYLALRTLSKRGTVAAVAHRIGCGKESDIILVQDEAERSCVLKLQRLGRCSFRSVTRNRDYKGNGRTRHGESWFYLSRLASQKEHSFMKVLYDEGFPVPKPIDQNRHALLMELVNGTLLNNITMLGDPEKVYRRSLDLMIKLAEHGLIHGDFNEFNLMITDDMRVIVIDFPQMISINHPNASELFQRDVENLANFFHRRFKVKTLFYPTLEQDVTRKGELDRTVYASGYFSSKQQQDLERLMNSQLGKENEEPSSDADSDIVCQEEEKEEEEEAAAAAAVAIVDNLEKVVPGVEAVQSHDDAHSNEKEEEEEEEKEEDDDNHDDANGESAVAAYKSKTKQQKSCVGEAKGRDEETCSETRSLDAFVGQAAQRRQQQSNANFTSDGNINEEYIRTQIRRNIRRKDNHDFNRNLHRNVQKGRDKQKVRRQVKQATSNGFFD